MDLGLDGRTALVTGSNRGTGSEIARVLAREGARVFVHGPLEGAGQDELCDDIGREGGQAAPVHGDLSCDEGAEQVRAQVLAAAHGIDVLINNLGGPASGSWQSATSDDWAQIYQHNVLSAVRMVRSFVDGMRERGWGRIIQLATIGVITPNKRMPHYYASKGALASMGVSLCKELSGTGITVNTVSPGLIHTAEVEAGFRATASKRGWGDDWAEIERRAVEAFMPNPSGRMARRQEVADLVAFIASERAGYVNGAHLRIDGGATGTIV
jgi:NAD(P)-dependent dehydrogenase (short-subunit alcohol dehydrogenase family)